MFENECANASIDLQDSKIFNIEQRNIFFQSAKSLSSSILTFASLSSFLADAAASSANELNTEFSRLLNTKNQNEIIKMTGYFSKCLNTIAAESANKNV
jgi:alpha-acetolactate decarboxylase